MSFPVPVMTLKSAVPRCKKKNPDANQFFQRHNESVSEKMIKNCQPPPHFLAASAPVEIKDKDKDKDKVKKNTSLSI